MEHDEQFLRVRKFFRQILRKFFSLRPKSSLEKIFQKKSIFPVTKDFGAFFLVLANVTNLTEQFIRVQKNFWIFCADTRSFVLHLRGC